MSLTRGASNAISGAFTQEITIMNSAAVVSAESTANKAREV